MTDRQAPQLARGLKRWLFTGAGWLSLGLGAIGVIVPLLPTTPLVILAAYFFARSSPRLHQWLLDNRVFGPLIAEWSEHRSIPRRAKILAVSMIVIFGSMAIYLVEFIAARLALGVLFASVMTWLLTRPTSPQPRVVARRG